MRITFLPFGARPLGLAAILMFAACSGDKDGSDSGTDTGGPVGDDDDDDDDDTMGDDDDDDDDGGGFNVSGVAVDALTQTPVAEGVCASLLDPTPALAGGAPETLGTATVGAGGAFEFTAISTTSTIGLLIDVRDCDAGATLYPSATGVPASAYEGLGDGDTLPGQTAFSIDAATAQGMEDSADPLGVTGLQASGFMFGFVLDAGGAPIGDATVTCLGTCEGTLYLDGDPTVGGLFAGDTGPNAATQAGVGIFVIPAAPISTYHADDGDAHAFTDQLNGSNPGIATITAFYGQ